MGSGLALAVTLLHSGLSGGMGAARLNLNEHLAAGRHRLWQASLCPWSLHPPASVLPLRAQNPSQVGPGIWGFFYLEERNGPSEGSLPPHPPNRRQAWGLLAGAGSLAANLAGVRWREGTRTSEDKVFPPLPLSSSLPPPCLPPSSSSKTHVSNPLSGPLLLPSPFPFPLGGIHCMWNSLGDPRELITQLGLGVGRGPVRSPMWRAAASPSGPCVALCSLELETAGAGHC